LILNLQPQALGASVPKRIRQRFLANPKQMQTDLRRQWLRNALHSNLSMNG
jgi:hypothetical protein